MQKVTKVCKLFLIALFVLGFVNFSSIVAGNGEEFDEERINELGLQLLDAAENGEVKEVERLLEEGAPVDFANERGETALHLACWRGHEDVVKVLVKRNSNVNAQNKWGETPLLYAALDNRVEICFYLLRNGADVSLKNDREDTVLDVCCNETIIKIDPKIINLLWQYQLRKQLAKVVSWPVKAGKRAMQFIGIGSSAA